MSFLISNFALNDIKDITIYTNDIWGEAKCAEYIENIYKAFSSLEQFPNIGSYAGYIRDGYKKYPAQKHMIIYQRTSETDIKIIRIIHQSMDSDNVLPE